MFIKKLNLLLIVLVTIVLVASSTQAFARDWDIVYGYGQFAGFPVNWQMDSLGVVPCDYEMRQGVLHPYLGFRQGRTEFGLEASLGKYRFHRSTSTSTDFVGLTLAGYYDFLKLNNLNWIYCGMGWGLAYWDKTPSTYLMNRSKVPVITQIDLGWKKKFNERELRVGYRFTHTSAARDVHDLGVNLQGIYIGIFF